ncbi:ABC transporter permease [Rhodopseudomonas palustris]|uniref:Transport permease protein n=1 Tax=Rhodopseudomonas palustris TaxID=1076 RepID=A0A323UAJ4_RHOPL|nr:ABC transporter permease [Rhodopseudomonas palustris]PZA09401.1 ABC transporter permease [Rhodopseudomonas palustris]
MNPYSTDLAAAANGLAANAGLLWELTKRDFVQRYKGSVFGVAWSLFTPLLMLAIYTFVFSVAFKARWGTADDGKIGFAIVLFSGLIVHGLFAECLTRAPSLITANPNYVKKVVFPLEILPLVTMGSALGNFAVSLAVLLVFCLLSGTPLHATGLLLPVLLLPLLLTILGLSWMLASLGVYLRDFAQLIGMVTTIALFLSPIFYPITALPPLFQSLLVLNPITLPVITLRSALLWGDSINWLAWTISLIAGAAIFYFGFVWFQKTRRGFADVL